MLQSLTIMISLWRLVVFSVFIVSFSCQCQIDVQDPDDPSMLNIVCVGESVFPNFDVLAGLQKDKISAIDVVNGSLTEIPAEAVADFPMLKKLDISGNRITSFARESLQYLPILTTINLSYNSLVCDETLIPWLAQWWLIDPDNRRVSGACTNTASNTTSNIQQLVESDTSTKNTVQFTDKFVTLSADTKTLEFTRSGRLDLATDFRVKAPNFTVPLSITVPSNENTGQVSIEVTSRSEMGNHTVELIPQLVIYPVATVVINRSDRQAPTVESKEKAVEPVSDIVVKSGSTIGSYIVSGTNKASELIVLDEFITTDNSGSVDLVRIELSYKFKDHESPIEVSVGKTVPLEDSVGFELKFTFTDPSNNQDSYIVSGDRVDITEPVISKPMIEFGKDDAITNFVITQITAGYRVVLHGKSNDKSAVEQSFEVTDNSGVVSFSWKVSYPNDSIVESSSKEDLEESLVGADEVTFTFQDTRGNKAERTFKINSGATAGGGSIGLIIVIILVVLVIIAIIAGLLYFKSKNSEGAKSSSSKAAVDVGESEPMTTKEPVNV